MKFVSSIKKKITKNPQMFWLHAAINISLNKFVNTIQIIYIVNKLQCNNNKTKTGDMKVGLPFNHESHMLPDGTSRTHVV